MIKEITIRVEMPNRDQNGEQNEIYEYQLGEIERKVREVIPESTSATAGVR